MEISYKNNRGLWRRTSSKTEDALFQAIDNLIRNKAPSCRKSGKNYDYVMIVINENLYESIKKLPQAVKKGRWLYIKYRRKLTFVRYVKISKPVGYKEIKISQNFKVDPKLLERIKPSAEVIETINTMKETPFEVNWELYNPDKKGDRK